MSRMEDTTEYKWALKVVLKRQMRDLFDQLHESGEEVAVMSVNLEDGTCSQFGSSQGEWFLQEQRNLTNNFLKHCQQSRKRKDSRKSIFKGPSSREMTTTIVSPSKDASALSSRKQPSSKDVEASPTMSTRSSGSGRRVSSKYTEGIAALIKRPRRQTEDGADEDETTEANVVGTKREIKDSSPNADLAMEVYSNMDEDEWNDSITDYCKEEGVSVRASDSPLMKAVTVTPMAAVTKTETLPQSSAPKRKTVAGRPRIQKKTDREKLQCSHCPLMIQGKKGLRAHIDRVHLNNRKATCAVCSKRFWRNCILQEHMLAVHTRQCESCQQYVVESTSWSEGVTMQTERNVMCSCGSTVLIFTHLGTKKQKEKPDERFACGVCHKLFLSRRQCEFHQKIHSDVKSYVCHVCGAGFRHGKSLQRHMNNLHKAGEYVCDMCRKTFDTENSLITHMNKVHEVIQSTGTDTGVEDERK